MSCDRRQPFIGRKAAALAVVALAGCATITEAVRVSVIGPQDNYMHVPRSTGGRAVALDSVSSQHVADLFSRVRGAPLTREDRAKLPAKDIFSTEHEPVLIDISDAIEVDNSRSTVPLAASHVASQSSDAADIAEVMSLLQAHGLPVSMHESAASDVESLRSLSVATRLNAANRHMSTTEQGHVIVLSSLAEVRKTHGYESAEYTAARSDVTRAVRDLAKQRPVVLLEREQHMMPSSSSASVDVASSSSSTPEMVVFETSASPADDGWRQRRLAVYTDFEAGQDKPLTEEDISQYQIAAWTGIGLFTTLFVGYMAALNMKIEPDSLLYAKFQSTRTGAAKSD